MFLEEVDKKIPTFFPISESLIHDPIVFHLAEFESVSKRFPH